MANKFMDTTFLDRAIIFAVKAHSNSERRGKGFPYIVHPMEAMEIVATMTKDQELLAAAALHDTIEDTDVTKEQIRTEFGERVANLVDAESDVDVKDMASEDSWMYRKKIAVKRIKSSSRDAKIVALGDKLSNMRAIARDYEMKGDELWKIFTMKDKRMHEWRFRELASAFSELEGTFAYREFVELIDKVFQPCKDDDLHTPQSIDINDYVESGGGYDAVSYNHRNGKTMIKMYSEEHNNNGMPQREITVSKAVLDMGFITPRPLRMVTDGSRIGNEYERISPKKSFARAISDQPETFETFAHTFAAMCRQLHTTPCDTETFPSIAEFYRKVVKDNTYLSEERKRKLYAFIDRVPEVHTCTHGDLHIGNVITDGTKNYWIDLSDFSWGNPKFDLAMWYIVANANPDEVTQKLYHISNDMMRNVWIIFARDYFGVTTDAELDEVEKELIPFAILRMLFFINHTGHIFPPVRHFIDDNFHLFG
jgi:uncharacterized protein (TIGR02172 family)